MNTRIFLSDARYVAIASCHVFVESVVVVVDVAFVPPSWLATAVSVRVDAANRNRATASPPKHWMMNPALFSPADCGYTHAANVKSPVGIEIVDDDEITSSMASKNRASAIRSPHGTTRRCCT